MPRQAKPVRAKAKGKVKRFAAFAHSLLGQDAIEEIFPEVVERRRIVGKQPPRIVLALQGPFGIYAGPTRVAKPARATLTSRGHYDELQLPRGATPMQIREAFRRRALLTHPDKGGRPEEFHAVASAFEVLSDVQRRAGYDAELQEMGNFDGLSEDGLNLVCSDPEDPARMALAERIETFRAMRSILNMLLSSKLQGVSETLSAQPPEVLKAMVQWLLCTCSRSSASLEDGDAKESSSRNRPKFTGIHRDKAGHGYSAYMYFEKLKARTQKTNSLAEAVDWHITLTQLKATAQARIRQMEDAEDFSGPLLTEDEVALAYQASPTMRLAFSSIWAAGQCRLTLPCTPDLALAIKLQAETKEALDRCTDEPNAKKIAVIRKIKDAAGRAVARQKLDNSDLEKRLLQAVHQELTKRAEKSGKPGEKPSAPRARDPVYEAMIQSRKRWRQQAEMAIELRDVLGLTHHDTMQAVHVLKNGSPELLKAARAVIRGEVVPILDIPSAQPEVKRARGKEEADDRGKKPRTGVLLSASSFLQAAALESDTGTSLLVPRGRPDAVLRPLLPLLDLRQRYMTRACSRTVHELVDLEARRQCRDFIFDAGLFMWDTGRGRLKPQTLTLRLASFVASHRDAIYHLDLGAAPTQMLQDERVQQAISKMRNLQDVVFPNHGWSSSERRSNFLACLPPGASAWGRNKVPGRG